MRDEQVLARMCDAITHRGPNDAGMLVVRGAALGMRRLSIIDVGGGHQPIANEDGSVQVILNGEIYNHHELRTSLQRRGHRFRTRSDTEVIVHLYEEHGDRATDHLRGMFALALWDARRERLLVARDRLGIKPLSWRASVGGGVEFFSELRSLLAMPGARPAVDEAALGKYLAFGYVPDPLTIFRGVNKLLPGHRLTWSRAEGVRVERWWTPPLTNDADVSEAEAVRRLRDLLADAVSSHLEAEVPLGAFLSGGLDSSTVVALMTRAGGRKVQTFAIGFDEPTANEAPFAKQVARELGTEHTELVVRPDVDHMIEGLVAAYDEPFADSSMIPTYLVSRLARTRVTVSLSGDGGDELFGGYNRYHEVLRAREWPASIRLASRALGSALPAGAMGRARLLDMGRTRQGRYAATVALPSLAADGGIVAESVARAIGPMGNLLDSEFAAAGGRDFATQMTLVDIATYLPGDILTKVDRASMAVSLEARVPLLDTPLVEFALALPARLKFRGGRGKHVFRQAIESIVPASVLTRPKHGFGIPLDRWFRGPLAHRIAELTHRDAAVRRYTDPSGLERVVREHQRGRRDHSAMLFRLLVLELWMGHLDSGKLARATANPLD